MFGSVEELLGYFCYPTDVRDSGEAYDARGRKIALSAESDDSPIVLTIYPEERPAELEALLREIVRSKPTRYDVLDAGANLEGLLRAVWRTHHREPFPGDMAER
jgi:hypothetical protein